MWCPDARKQVGGSGGWGGREARKLESILHFNNGITVANKAGTVACRDPSPPFFCAGQPSAFTIKRNHPHAPAPPQTHPNRPEFCGHSRMYVRTSPALERITSPSHQQAGQHVAPPLHHRFPAVCSNATHLQHASVSHQTNL